MGSPFRWISSLVGAASATVLLAGGCGDASPTGPDGGIGGEGGFFARDRADRDRTPLEGACDDIDAARCLLPWPSDAFTRPDPAAATGLRLAVPIERMNAFDDGSVFARADGFSRTTPLVASFAEALDPGSVAGSVRLLLAQPGHARRGEEVPLRTEVVVTEAGVVESVVVADPRVPLEANADYVVVIDDRLRATGGGALTASRWTQIALEQAAPRSQREADYRGHHAPLRRLLADVGIDPSSVLRAWTFTTRSAEDPRKRLRAMREAAMHAVDADRVQVVIDSVETLDAGAIAGIVRGRLAGLPDFLGADGVRIDETGQPVAVGTREAPFRVVVPRGDDDYRVVLFGHGTGGSVDDASFDVAIAEAGAAKVSFEFYGWTGDSVIATFVGLQDIARGSSVAAGSLVQAVADGSAVRHALSGVLGDALAAPELGGEPNPHAGRRPDDSIPLWAGGSLGGTMGLVFTAANPEVSHAVLNVPGAAWMTWTRDAEQFRYIAPFLAARNGGPQNVPLAVAMGQTLFDEADGAAWIDVLRDEHPIVALAQESIGDPVLPNAGTEMVAHVLGASIVGVPLVPIEGIAVRDEVRGSSGLTQYWVEGDVFEVHGFAAQDTPAGAAATEQVIDFVESVWAGAAVIEVPSGCAENACDFR